MLAGLELHGCLDPSSISCLYGGQCPHHRGGHQMVPNITAILQRLTGEWAALLQPEAILAACGEVGYTGWRDRVLTPVTTVPLFLWQILHGNTACSHLPHLSGLRFSAAAYCQARARLPLRFFDLLLERFGRAVQRAALDEERWHGHRTFLVDGSACSMPDMPALQDAFGQSTEQRPGCGLPTRQITLVTTLLDAADYLAELYRLRWQVEASLAHLKTTMQMEILHGQTVPGVLKELTVF